MSSICIHVLNVGQGDSIVLDFAPSKGKSIWGLVDCYETKDKPHTSPFKFLEKRKNASFVCLTHPHQDHYKGMLNILEYFNKGGRKVTKFWHFGIDKETLEFLTGRSKTKKHYNELWQLNAFVFSKKSKHKMDYDYFSKNWECLLGSKGRTITIKALSLISDKIVDELKNLGRSAGREKNLLSIALVIMFGNKNILLGADTDAFCWNKILQLWKEYCVTTGRNRKFDFIKVSHHGSKDGNIQELWKNFTKGEHTIAVISSGCKGEMPHPDTIETILSNDVKLYSTNLWDFSRIAPRSSSARCFQLRGCVTQKTLEMLSGLFELKHLSQELKKERRISSKGFKVLMDHLNRQLQSLEPYRPYYHGTCSTTFNKTGQCRVVTQSGKPPISFC